MTFLDLYGDSLDFELGTEDRVERFTLARRKAALNKAQLDWLRQTDCITAHHQIDLIDSIGEYDLDNLINDDAFFRLSEEQPFMVRTNVAGAETITDARDFPQLDVERLDREQPGWRMSSAGVPASWYLRDNNNQSLFGVVPPPRVPLDEQWYVRVPYTALPVPMVDDTDLPLRSRSAGATGRKSLEPYHQAIVHRAAYYLEKLRKNTQGMIEQAQLYQQYLQDYRETQHPKGGDRIVMGHHYFRIGRHMSREPDPYRD